MSDFNKKESKTVFSQPGMRYSQAEALIKSLMLDEKFRELSLADRKYITERILNEIKGRMMEDIVLLETMFQNPEKEVFKLQFAVGEYDMVVFDPKESCCEIFEVKHSMEIAKEQYRHLIDKKKNDETEFRYGPVKNKYVIYRGESTNVQLEDDTVIYVNVEEYLNGLG
jgi:hypothetical protein